MVNYKTALYRKNNAGQPCFWEAFPIGRNIVQINHGIIGKSILQDTVKSNRSAEDEIKSRINEKRKAGYKYLIELRDNNELPVEGELMQYLVSYLPNYRTSGAGNMLPMLAKVYDNTNNKLFKKVSTYLGQYKINGLRCFISASKESQDLFKPVKLQFQSREGTIWNSLGDLEDYLLSVLPQGLIDRMCDEEYILDGELYLPGHTVNEINHFVKDATCKENKLLQYWCYDIAIQSTIQYTRNEERYNYLDNFEKRFYNKDIHLANTDRLISLPNFEINDGNIATQYRNLFIDCGFEGLIMRNPDAEYQYGARNSAMIKYKKATDGKFVIIAIYPEGIKRQDIPLFKLKNDINDACFEVHVSGSFGYQKYILEHKQDYIGKTMFVEYGERSGISQVPFHVKETYIMS